jgi:hypothetical protein
MSCKEISGKHMKYKREMLNIYKGFLFNDMKNLRDINP